MNTKSTHRAFGWIRSLTLLLALTIVCPLTAHSQTTVNGTVTDETGEPLIGATVVVQGTNVAVATDFDGNFTLTAPKGATTLDVSYVGYKKQSVAIASKVDVMMQPDSQVMNEVVVIGYGVQKKSDLTGSIATVSEKDFNKGVISSPEELINGKIAGVQIVNSGGSPNGSSTIRVRGGASLNASNDPLIVLDGVPMEVGGSVSGQGNFWSLINPNDIESMTVLKDASSTAIYGSRASNGVIIITTKKGSGEGVKVSFSTTNSISHKTKTAPMLSRSQFIDAYNQYGTADQIALIGTYNTDWNDQIYRTAFGTDNSLSVSGRIASWLPFRAALGVTSQQGIVKTDNSNRTTFNLNLTPSFLDDHLRINLSGKGSYSHNRFAQEGAIWTALVYNPTVPVYDENSIFNGYYNTYTTDANGVQQIVNGAQPNPLGQLENYNSKSNVGRFIGNADIDYRLHPLPELRLHVTGGYDYSRGNCRTSISKFDYNNYTVSYDENGDPIYTGGYRQVYSPQKNYNKLFTAYANYNKDFKAINSTVDATIGYDYQYWKYTCPVYYNYNYDGDQLQYTGAAIDQRHSLISYYGRLNFTFDNRYLLTATFRRDGSSRFSKDNRWGTFPSVALAWRVSGEKFWQAIQPVVNDFKIRASYGKTGQQDGIANYSYLPVYTIGQDGAQYQFGGVPYYTYRPEAYNSNLKWETTKSWNFGVDLGLLNNRITLSADYYTRRTEDLLATVPIAAGINFDKQMLTNVGNVKSNGVELALNANVITTKDWSWTVTANATYQKVKITNLTLNDASETAPTPVGYIESTPIQYFSTGHAPYAYLLYKQIYDEATGKPIEGLYADLNGDGQITSDDRYYCHHPAPDWILGFSTSLRWKKWTLSTSLRANIGNYVYNGMEANMGAWECTTWASGQINNLSSSFAKTGFQTRQYASDYYLENASFLKMDNVQLSYDFGRIYKSLNLHISAMVQNVFTWTNYKGIDPETASGCETSVYPRPRTYSLTVGLNF